MIRKYIDGYNDLYKISHQGDVLNMNTGKKIIQYNIGGYSLCCLKNNNGWKTKSVHRLVADAFIENPLNKKQVDHINNIKSDNRVENLQRCTSKENINYKFNRDGYILSQEHAKKISISNSIQIYQYTKQGKFIKERLGMRNAGRVLGIKSQNIYRVCKGQAKSAGGYIWSYDCNVEGRDFKLQI